MSANGEMALADRIQIILDEMPGQKYGKQSRLAEVAGCGRPVVNHWLSKKQKEIKYEHAKNIADKLGYRMDWLVEGKGPKRSDEREPEPQQVLREETLLVKLTVGELKLITHYRAATAEGKHFIEMAAATAPKDAGDQRH